MEKYNKTVGNIGEKAAVKHLKKNGYKIIKTNFYVKGGEIDIIAQKDGYVVFVEVKTRSNNKYGTPIEAVNFVKQQRMRRAAAVYTMANGEGNMRFDVIGVNCTSDNDKIKITKIQHIINAF